jgi:cysteine desulfurase
MNASDSQLIYFNNNRSTRLDAEVSEAMNEACQSGEKIAGDHVVLETKTAISEMIGSKPEEILITKGTTPSIDGGLRLAFDRLSSRGNHIITTNTEHPAVLDICKKLKSEGAELSAIGVNPEGIINLDELADTIRADTAIICVMAANNETGVIQPVEKIALLCRQKNIVFFSDASQYVGKLRCDVSDPMPDMMAFGSHKMYGPPDIGALYIRHGLMQEWNIRPQHEWTPTLRLAAGFSMAAAIFLRDYWESNAAVSKLRAYFEHQLLEIPGLRINGSTRYRLYNTSNICFPPSINIQPLLERFDFAHNLNRPSHVLKAMGLTDDENQRSFRFSFGKFNTLEEVKKILNEVLALTSIVPHDHL